MFVGLLTLSLSAQEKTAKIEFKNETIDYGEIEKGSDGVRVFEFTNNGDAPLVISDVKSSCGCTIPKKPEDPITVISNADTPTKVLKIKGTVKSEGAK